MMEGSAEEPTGGKSCAEPGRKRPGWALLKTRDFGLLFSGQLISQIGDGLSRVALLWFVYELTGSALKMTLVGLLQTVPPLLFGPFIGVYLDWLPKKPVLIWVDLVRALLVLLIPALYALDTLSLGRLYVLVFLVSVVSAVFGPALSSAVPLLITRPQLTAANALLQSTANIGVLIGPAIGGIGIALVGAPHVLVLHAAAYLLSVFCLVPIRIRDVRSAAAWGSAGALMRNLLIGFRFVFSRRRPVVLLMIITGLFNLGVSAFVFLLPVVAKELLRVGPVELGWLWSALGLGMLLASVGLAWFKQAGVGRSLGIVASAMAVGGISVCSLSLPEAPLLAAGLVLVIGASTALFIPVVWTLLQGITPVQLLGRVFTTFSTGGMASAMAGMAGFGWLADAVGPAASLIGIGLVFLLTAALAVRVRRLMGVMRFAIA